MDFRWNLGGGKGGREEGEVEGIVGGGRWYKGRGGGRGSAWEDVERRKGREGEE